MDADDISPRMENTSSPRVLENMSSAELLDNLSLAQPDNVTWVETVVLVESGVLMGNSTNWRQQLDFPLLQVETHIAVHGSLWRWSLSTQTPVS